MHRNTKVTLDAFTELRRRLNGKCGDTCPKITYKPQSITLYTKSFKRNRKRLRKEFCDNYCTNFYFINHKAVSEDQIYTAGCPCYRGCNPEELFLYLDEYIEELQEQLSKEYSS